MTMKAKKLNLLMRVVEMAWMAVAAVCAVEVYMRWDSDRETAYIFLLILAVSGFMYIFRKRQRIKTINRKYNKEQ